MAGRSIASPSDASSMRTHVDLQHLRIFRVRHQRGRLAADRTDQRSFRQRHELFLDGQVRIVAPIVTARDRAARRVSSWSPWFPRDRINRWNGRRRQPSPTSAKEFVLQGRDLTTGLVKFLLQLFDPFDGIGVSAFPIAHLATKLPDLALQLAQFPFQPLQGRTVRASNRRFGRRGRRGKKRGTHKATLYPD